MTTARTPPSAGILARRPAGGHRGAPRALSVVLAGRVARGAGLSCGLGIALCVLAAQGMTGGPGRCSGRTEPNEPESAWSQDRQAICAHKNRVAGPPSEMGASRLAEGGSETLSKALEVPYLVNDKAGFETRSSTAQPLSCTHCLPARRQTSLEKGLVHRLQLPARGCSPPRACFQGSVTSTPTLG